VLLRSEDGHILLLNVINGVVSVTDVFTVNFSAETRKDAR